MGDIVQYVLAGMVVIAAIVAAVRSAMRASTGKKSALTACAECKLNDVCQKPEKNSVKKCADKVAQVKNTQ